MGQCGGAAAAAGPLPSRVKLNIATMSCSQVATRHRGRNFEMAMSAYYISPPGAHGFIEQMAFNPGNSAEEKGNAQYPSWCAAYSDPYFNENTEKALLERDQT